MKWHSFRGIRYRVYLDEKVEGYAEAPGPRKPRELYVDPDLSPKEYLRVLIHEAMHCEDPDAHEQVVDRRSRALARFLWRCDYRRITPDG
jgi:hypothetical protein